MSQQKLGEAVGLTFQQIQKYERGTNRVGSSRMYELARVLGVPVAYFFEDTTRDVRTRAHAHTLGRAVPPAELDEQDPMTKRETLEFVRAYYRIKDRRIQKQVFNMTKTLAVAGSTRP